MNKKIYFESKFILITDRPIQLSENQLIVDAENVSEIILIESVKNSIQQPEQNNLILVSKNVEETFQKIKTAFIFIEAAGGLIKNGDNYLFIHRLNKWDLPKGKLDKGESKEHAAIRECEEECGISDLEILAELQSTYHIYHYKNVLALKITYWFLMRTSYSRTLIPQTEEHIDKAEWMNKEQIKNMVVKKTYPSVLDVIKLSIDIE